MKTHTMEAWRNGEKIAMDCVDRVMVMIKRPYGYVEVTITAIGEIILDAFDGEDKKLHSELIRPDVACGLAKE